SPKSLLLSVAGRTETSCVLVALTPAVGSQAATPAARTREASSRMLLTMLYTPDAQFLMLAHDRHYARARRLSSEGAGAGGVRWWRPAAARSRSAGKGPGRRLAAGSG